jgi:hypothetical protein
MALAQAKSDCDIAVDADIDLLVNESAEPITKDTKKAIKRAAKALAAGKGHDLKIEATALSEVVDISISM